MQLISDVHLEAWSSHEFAVAPAARDICLAGDVGDPCSAAYLSFLSRLSGAFANVFVVAGNHECYGRTVEAALDAIDVACDSAGPNVWHLDRSSVALEDGSRLAGATLWSRLEPENWGDVRRGVNDFRRVRRLTRGAYNALHDAHVAWIASEIESCARRGQVIKVATHHAPSFRALGADRTGDPCSGAFCSRLDRLFGAGVAWWAFGHTHRAFDAAVNGTRLVSNPRGYPGEDTGFDPFKTIIVDDFNAENRG